jgi:hypothetical protein
VNDIYSSPGQEEARLLLAATGRAGLLGHADLGEWQRIPGPERVWTVRCYTCGGWGMVYPQAPRMRGMVLNEPCPESHEEVHSTP